MLTFIKRFNDLISESNDRYGITLPTIDLRFDLRGRSAGQAIRKGNTYSIRLNTNINHDHILNDTIPHELAHIICMYTGWDKGHGKIWKTICQTLGGTGNRCHSEEVTLARKVKKFSYTTTCGQVITVSTTRHNKIQNGTVYKIPSTGGRLIRDSWTQIA